MTSTFSQIYIHVVFSVKNRQKLIDPMWEEELYKYMTGVIRNKDQKLLAINGMADHIHILIGMKPSCCLSDLIREVKKTSNEYINTNKLTKAKFEWQRGYGAFSYSQSALNGIITYIENQKEHYKIKTFMKEYKDILDKFDVGYKDEYL